MRFLRALPTENFHPSRAQDGHPWWVCVLARDVLFGNMLAADMLAGDMLAEDVLVGDMLAKCNASPWWVCMLARDVLDGNMLAEGMLAGDILAGDTLAECNASPPLRLTSTGVLPGRVLPSPLALLRLPSPIVPLLPL